MYFYYAKSRREKNNFRYISVGQATCSLTYLSLMIKSMRKSLHHDLQKYIDLGRNRMFEKCGNG